MSGAETFCILNSLKVNVDFPRGYSGVIHKFNMLFVHWSVKVNVDFPRGYSGVIHKFNMLFVHWSVKVNVDFPRGYSGVIHKFNTLFVHWSVRSLRTETDKNAHISLHTLMIPIIYRM